MAVQPSSVGLVLVAAGAGTRLGAAQPKAFVRLADRSLLAHAVLRLAPSVDRLVVVAPRTHLRHAEAEVGDALGPGSSTSVAVVAGGSTRAGSVAAGLAAVGDVDVVAVHDVARPMASAAVLRRCVTALDAEADAAAPAVTVTDTLKRIAVHLPGTGDASIADVVDVIGTEDRSRLRAVQTPQVFRLQTLLDAHAANTDPEVTDDLALVEARGGRVVLVPGGQRLMKVTHPLDIIIAEALLADELAGEGTATVAPG